MNSSVKQNELKPPLVLASASPRRLALMMQIGISPDHLHATSVDETPKKYENPRALAVRLAYAKAVAARDALQELPEFYDALFLAADTVVASGRKILQKPKTEEEAYACLKRLSGRSHKVYTSVVLVNRLNHVRMRFVESRVRFMRLTPAMKDVYIQSGEWKGKAGGYAIQGLAGSFVTKLSGSYTNVMGLPLNETMRMLADAQYPVLDGWSESGV